MTFTDSFRSVISDSEPLCYLSASGLPESVDWLRCGYNCLNRYGCAGEVKVSTVFGKWRVMNGWREAVMKYSHLAKYGQHKMLRS